MFEVLMCVGFLVPVLVYFFNDIKNKKILDVITFNW